MRGVCFKDIEEIIEKNNHLDLLENPSRENQQIYIIVFEGYVHAVPCVFDKKENVILKPIYPSRKYHKQYKHLL